MSLFDQIPDDEEIIYVVEDVEAAKKQMAENDGKFSGNLVPKVRKPEEYMVRVIPQAEGCAKLWKDIMSAREASNTKIRSDIYTRTGKWHKAKYMWLAALVKKTADAPVAIALISKNNLKSSSVVNLIDTYAPVMPLPFVSMLLQTLDEMARNEGTGLIIPKEYLPSLDAPVEVEAAPQSFDATDLKA